MKMMKMKGENVKMKIIEIMKKAKMKESNEEKQ